MWAVQPALAGALNREFRHQSKEDEDEDRLYPVVLVRPPLAFKTRSACAYIFTSNETVR